MKKNKNSPFAKLGELIKNMKFMHSYYKWFHFCLPNLISLKPWDPSPPCNFRCTPRLYPGASPPAFTILTYFLWSRTTVSTVSLSTSIAANFLFQVYHKNFTAYLHAVSEPRLPSSLGPLSASASVKHQIMWGKKVKWSFSIN